MNDIYYLESPKHVLLICLR